MSFSADKLRMRFRLHTKSNLIARFVMFWTGACHTGLRSWASSAAITLRRSYRKTRFILKLGMRRLRVQVSTVVRETFNFSASWWIFSKSGSGPDFKAW